MLQGRCYRRYSVINRIHLRWFKCFEHLELPLGALTLLAGRNSSGKSSILQAFALLHQTMREHHASNHLTLNGNTIRLGTLSDVVDDVHGRGKFEIGLMDGDLNYNWEFSGERDAMLAQVTKVRLDDEEISNPKFLWKLLPADLLSVDDVHQLSATGKQRERLLAKFSSSRVVSFTKRLQELSYLTAERLAPKDFYNLEDPITSNVIGPRGENAISLLFNRQDDKVLPELRLEGPITLPRQLGIRMRTIFPGLIAFLDPVPSANGATLGFRTSDASGFHRPLHAGFGLTQVLPIITAALASPKEGILLIENPEVHLHPAGQALIGEFLGEVASAGIQVVVETHSDHILNGIRRSVKSGKLQADETAIYFFKLRDEPGPQVLNPVLNSEGNVDIWPEGFFDQFDKDMNFFAGWGG